MKDLAHGVEPQHPIFQSPHPVELTLVEHPIGEKYRNYPEGVDLPDRIMMWPVQTRTFPTLDPGLVSSPAGFDDADAEFIASGLNEKGPRSIAIGRHGNFMTWGFFASPSDLTEEARKVFINAIVYMQQFDGQQPIASRKAMARNDAFQYFLWATRAPMILIRTFGEKLVRETFKDDLAGLEQYLRENYDYLWSDDRVSISVDEDVQQIGIANNDIALLERCIALIDSEATNPVERARAMRVLRRYTDQTWQTAEQWRRWLDAHRDRMFFSEVGGYRWYIFPEASAMPSTIR